MIASNQKQIIRSTFLCGLGTFLINAVVGVGENISLTLILSNILPGFAFGAVLAFQNKYAPDWKRILFVVCSGSFFILMAWLAGDFQLSLDGQLRFLLASLIGIYGLLFFYRLLLETTIFIWRAFLFGTLSAIASAFFPGKAYYDNHFTAFVGTPYHIFILMSIFLTWQTLFGITLVLSSPPMQNKSLTPVSINNVDE